MKWSVTISALVLSLMAPLTSEAQQGHLRWHVVRKTVKIPASGTPFISSCSGALTADGRWLVVGGAATAYLSILDAQTLAPLKKIKTAGDATDNLISVDGGRKIVATAGYSLYRSNAARHLFVLDARAEPELLGKVEVGINPGFHLNLGDGTVLVPAVHGQRITRVDTRDKKALESMSTRKWRFHPTWASGRSDQRIAVITGGAFRGGRMPFGEKLLVLDPMSPS